MAESTPETLGAVTDEDVPRSPSPSCDHGLREWSDVLIALSGGHHTFAVGGSLPISAASSRDSAQEDSAFHVEPVTIRWHDHGGNQCVTLPSKRSWDIKKLMGIPTVYYDFYGQREDEDRKRFKLKAKDFCTSFNPYTYGLINIISNTLMQASLREDEKFSHEMLMLDAQLDAINIHALEYGRIKTHIKSSRETPQFGSLVVCLPVKHEGGTLRISHFNKDMLFDWSEASQDQIQWAAFLSGCEDEVTDVTSGHRVTLIYKLIVRRHHGSVARPFPTAQTAVNPLTKSLQALKAAIALDQVLGYYCVQQYHHTVTRDVGRLENILKGGDAMVYMAMKDAGFDVTLRPVLQRTEDHLEDEVEYREGTRINERGDMSAYFGPARRDPWIEEVRDDGNGIDVMGKAFFPLNVSQVSTGELGSWFNDVLPLLGGSLHRGIKWLDTPTVEQLAVTYKSCGGEYHGESVYTAVAIIAKVPNANDGKTAKLAIKRKAEAEEDRREEGNFW